MGQELGLDGQSGVFPLSDRFAEMGGIPVNDDGGEHVEPGHAVVLAFAGAVADFAPAPDAERVLECVMSLAFVAISPSPSPSQDQPPIAHSTDATPLSLRFCPLPESTPVMQTGGGLSATKQYPPQHVTLVDDPLFLVGGDHILFLESVSGDTVHAPSRQLYRIVNPAGRYDVDGESVITHTEFNAELLPKSLDDLIDQIERETTSNQG